MLSSLQVRHQPLMLRAVAAIRGWGSLLLRGGAAGQAGSGGVVEGPGSHVAPGSCSGH